MSSEPAPSDTVEVAFIIGGHGSIGTALSQRLLARGAKLVLAGRDLASVQAAAARFEADAGRVEAIGLDARDFDATAEAIKSAAARHGRLSSVLNLAGSIVLKPAHSTSSNEFDEVIATNLRTAFSTVRAAGTVLGQGGGGSIVLMSSAVTRVGLANHDAIAAAKAGVSGLTRSAAATYAPRNVRVNAVAPGLVRSRLSARIVDNESARKASEAMHPLGRLGEPTDVASLLSWLVHPDNSWMTGQVLGLDGGLGAVHSSRKSS